MTSPGITAGIPGGHGHALLAAMRPVHSERGSISVGDSIASRGESCCSGNGKDDKEGIVAFHCKADKAVSSRMKSRS